MFDCHSKIVRQPQPGVNCPEASLAHDLAHPVDLLEGVSPGPGPAVVTRLFLSQQRRHCSVRSARQETADWWRGAAAGAQLQDYTAPLSMTAH